MICFHLLVVLKLSPVSWKFLRTVKSIALFIYAKFFSRASHSHSYVNGLQLLDLPGIIEGAKDGKGRGRQVSRA